MGSVIIVTMASSKLTLLFAIVLWASVEGTPTGEESPIELTERELEMREMEMKRLFEDRAAMMEATDRDMHNWWAEYDILMANYRAMFADNVCHNPDMLNASLAIIEAKIEKVRWGWTLKGEQLDLIRDILNHEDYKNPAPSTANGASGLPGQSATLSMVMETGTVIGCTLSQPCLEAVSAKEIATKPKLATTCLSADRRNRNKPKRSKGWRTSWKTESNSCNQFNNQCQS